jgi:hypothetical protein
VLSLLLSLTLSAAPLQDSEPVLLEPDRRRVLQTSEGLYHRGRARQTESGWETWRDRAWQPVPLSIEIQRSALERDLLREAKSLGGALPKTDTGEPHTGAQLSYARWLLESGLFPEGLDVLDELLGRHPNHDSTRVVLAKLTLPEELPTLRSRDAEEVKRAFKLTLAFAKKKGAAHRELAIRRLAELRDPARTLTPLLSVGKAHERALAAHALRRLAPAKSLEPLLRRCALDGSREVRAEAAHALAATGEEGVILPLVRALSSEYSSVRANSAEALGVAGFPAAVPALKAQLSKLTSPSKASGQTAPPRSHIFVGKQTAYVQDFDVEVAQGAAVADPQVNTLHQGAVLDVRVIAVTSSATATRTELAAVRAALASLKAKDVAEAPSAN